MDDFEKYLNSSLRYLALRPRSEKEVVDKLLEKKAPQEIIDRIVARLKDHKFLSDMDFARWFIEQRLRFKPKSLGIIKLELKQKGIDKETIDAVISNFKFQISNNTNDLDLDSAKKLVEKRIDRYTGLSKQEIYQKLGGYLARRGFNWDTIKKSIDSEISRS